VNHPRLLLVPDMSELEWRTRPLLEEWADVAFFDAPGVGDEPPPKEFSVDAVVERGLAELDRLGWDGVVVVADEFATPAAIRIATAAKDRVAALALGHACLGFLGKRRQRALNQEVEAAFRQVARTDFRSYVRALTQITQGAYDDELADKYMERLSPDVVLGYQEAQPESEAGELERELRGLDVPILLAEHRGCILFTREGYQDAVAALPHAETASCELKPSASPEFAADLREFCARIRVGEPADAG
jgi:pimeloyl-ACP methyl ester carboxylesterase